jgi:hypothetical protein
MHENVRLLVIIDNFNVLRWAKRKAADHEFTQNTHLAQASSACRDARLSIEEVERLLVQEQWPWIPTLVQRISSTHLGTKRRAKRAKSTSSPCSEGGQLSRLLYCRRVKPHFEQPKRDQQLVWGGKRGFSGADSNDR